jgi:hypothetical protein
MQSLYTPPLAVLAEGGLGHALHGLLTCEPLDGMFASQDTFEAAMRLLDLVASKDILKPLLLMPAGPSEALLGRQLGLGTAGECVADAVNALHRAAERYQKKGAVLNEVNEEGIHINVDPALQFVIFVESTCEKVQEVRVGPKSG